MIAALTDYPPKIALGLVARAALEVEDEGNPAATSREPNEADVRQRIFAEVRSSIGVALDDQSPSALERLSDALDEELDRIVEKTD